MTSKIFEYFIKHKVIAFITLALIIGVGYYGYGKIFTDENSIRYATASVEKGTLIVSIPGNGQVSASNELDIKPKTSGDLIYVGVKNGQEVRTGQLLFKVDTNDAQRAVQDAEISLELAKVQLEELLEPPEELTLLQAENSLNKAKEAKQKALDGITEGYEDAFNTITDIFFDLPTIITELTDILYSEEIADSETDCSSGWNRSCLLNSIGGMDYNYREELERFIEIANDNYRIVREKFDENFENYRDTSRYAEPEVIIALLDETLETLRSTAELIKSEINMLDYWVDYRSQRDRRIYGKVNEYQSNLKSYTSKVNNHLSTLLRTQRSFDDNEQAVLDAEYTIKEKELSLEKLTEGADDLDIRTKKLAIQQKEKALAEAQKNLANCYIYAPFGGIVTAINDKVKHGDSVSSGTSLATLITNQKIAEITLNEIDIAQVETGQKVSIVLDAIDGLEITGEVTEVDTLGTITQGVVTYGVKIVFDTQDERIKPGMSLGVSIITDVKQNVLLVSNSAIKQQNDTSYVQMVDGVSADVATANIASAISDSNIKDQPIQIGLSNDTMTEVLGGLEEGDIVITQSISSANLTQQVSSQSSRNAMQGGMMRMVR